jgi:predicted RND superfamily exporter protein
MLDFIFNHNKKIITLFIVVFVSFLTYLPHFSLDASSDSLVLEDDADLLFYQKLRKTYPSDNNLIIAYKADENILNPKPLKHIKNLVAELQSIAQVKSTTSILNVPLFLSPKLSLTELATSDIQIGKGGVNLNLAKNEFHNSPIYRDNLVSLDGKTTAIIVNTSGDIDNAIINIRESIAKYQNNATLFLGGVPMITHDVLEYIASDLVVFGIGVVVVMALVLFMIFRSLRFMFLPIVISLANAIFITSLISFLGWKITVISANFFSLLLVLTLAVIIHLIVRYRELALKIDDKKELITQTVKQMFKPCLYTTLTTLIAFISLLISGIRPVIDFGFIMSIGVSLAFVFAFLIFILTMHLLPKMQIKQHQNETTITTIFANFTHKFPKLLLTLVLILSIFTIVGISKTSVENKFINYFKDSTEISQGLSLIDEKLGGTMDLEIIFTDLGYDYFYDEFIREDIAKVHQYLENRVEVGKVLSIETLMQILTTANEGKLGGFFLNIAKNNIAESAKQQVYYPYINEDTGQLRIVGRIKENTKDLNRNQLIQEIKTDLITMGFREDSFRISGMLVLYNNMLQSLFDSQIKTIGLVFVMIWLMFIILFKSIKIGTIAIIPNIIPALAIIGLMGLLGISLDLMTITIASIAIGIGVDDAIHYISRFKEEFNKTNNYETSMFNSHASIGKAMFYTSITIIIGFSVLILSNFIPSIYFGIFTGIAMLLAVVLNLTLLPKLLVSFKPKFD